MRTCRSDIYRAKLTADANCERDGIPRLTLLEFVFQYFKEKYGTKELVRVLRVMIDVQ